MGTGAAFCNPQVVATLHARNAHFIPEMLLQKNSGYTGMKNNFVTVSEASTGPVNVGLGKKWKGECVSGPAGPTPPYNSPPP